MSAALIDERARLVARIAEIDELLAVAPECGFTRDHAPAKTWCRFGLDEGGGSSHIGDAWCSTWVRQLQFPADLDRDEWAGHDDEDLYAVVRTWVYLVTYGGGEQEVFACTAYQICTDTSDPDRTELDHWLDYCEGAASGYHRDSELQAMAVADEPPTVELWNQIVVKAGDSWAQLDIGD